MKYWLQFLAVLVMVVIAGISPRPATAAPSVGSAGTASTTRIINDIIRRTPGITSRTTTGTGVTVAARAVGSVGTATGATIPIAEAASAAVSAGRIAGVIAKAVRWGSFAGIASMVLPWVAEQSGIKVCPPPDFFCMPGPDVGAPPSAGGWYYIRFWGSNRNPVFGFGTHASVCTAFAAVMAKELPGNLPTYPLPWSTGGGGNSNPYCTAANGGIINAIGNQVPTCPEGSVRKGTDCLMPGPDKPAQEADIADAVEKGITGNPSRVGQAFDAASNAGFPMFTSNDQVAVETPDAVSAPQTSTTTQVPKPDGSIDNVFTLTDVKVTPKVDGNTIGDAKITYPTTITTTTKTTNNVTNVTTTTTTITNTYSTPDTRPPPANTPPITDYPTAPGVKTEDLKIPDDYNREVTQKSILGKLEEFMKPITTTLPDGNAEVESVQAKNAEGLGVVAGITPETVNVKNWFPSVPTTACVDPQVPVPLGGGTVTFPICGYVNTFSNLISGVIAFFCILGCVHQVQTALKA